MQQRSPQRPITRTGAQPWAARDMVPAVSDGLGGGNAGADGGAGSEA